MPGHYRLFVVESAGKWALEIEDATGAREAVRQFDDAHSATQHAHALSHQLSETGDSAEVHVSRE